MIEVVTYFRRNYFIIYLQIGIYTFSGLYLFVGDLREGPKNEGCEVYGRIVKKPRSFQGTF